MGISLDRTLRLRMAPVFRILALLLLAAAAASAQPVVTSGGLLNAASYLPFTLPNGGIAPGSLFVIFGTGLGPADLAQTSYPLPKTLAGTSVSVSIGGVAPVGCLMVYTLSTQVAAVLPSQIASLVPNGGNGSLTVSFNGRSSAPVAIRVLPAAFGMFTLNQAGSGPAVVQNVNSQTDQPVNTLMQAAKPGQTVILWGTGLGAVPGDEAAAPLPGNLRLNIQLYVGTVAVIPDYAGRSGCCAGVDEVFFKVPPGVEGCYVPIIVVLNGIIGNIGTMSISSNGPSCSDPNLSSSDLATAQANGSLRSGEILFTSAVASSGGQQVQAGGIAATFTSIPFNQLLTAPSQDLPPAGCFIQNSVSLSTVTPKPLDAGPALNVSGPGGSRTVSLAQTGAYSLQFTGSLLSAGNYTVTNGSGGSGPLSVGSFSAPINLPGPLSWDDESSANALDVKLPLTVHWSGVDPASRVVILGEAINPNPNIQVQFVCTASGSLGGFTVPPFILSALPTGTTGSDGFVAVQVYGGNRFSAPGLDTGWIVYTSGQAKAVTWQNRVIPPSEPLSVAAAVRR